MKKVILLMVFVVALASCKKESPSNNTGQSGQSIPDKFAFETSNNLTTNISVKDIENAPIKGVRIDVFTPDGSKRIFSGATNASGNFNTKLRIPSYLKEVMVRCRYVGFENEKIVPVNGSFINTAFGGVPPVRKAKKTATATQTITPAGGNLYYIGSYSSTGIPNYFENPGDVVNAAFLADVNTALPEYQPVPTFNPQYLASNNYTDIHMIATGDVWITFVSEGAGAKNSLGYFTYPTANPPATANDIDSIFILLPNASVGSSGGMLAGDKVKLGTFDAGTSIGWVLIYDGWNASTQGVKVNNTRFYSFPDFNPEPHDSLQQHNVQIWDNIRNVILVGFEDIQRNYSTDNDFNDVVFYVTATPFSSVDKQKIPLTPNSDPDDDLDGVKDSDDDYPTDFDRAFDNFYTGGLGFEDLWPSQGDYDFNDLVMGYNTNMVTDANNDVKDINTTYTIRALGGYIDHGFGVKLDDVASGDVESVTGSQITQNLATLNANGTESGQTDAVYIVYDLHSDQMQNPGAEFINTQKNKPTAAPVDINIDLTFSSAQDPTVVGLPPFNPFLFTESNRGREIHLADKEPTDLVNSTFFGQGDDDSDPGNDRYYKNENNMPWGIHIDGSYSYPIEYMNINNAHLKFSDWATSGGTLFNDWYLELPGYRDANNIY